MSVPLQLLILEDRQADLETILQVLREAGFDPQYEHASREEDFLLRLTPSLQMILADCQRPGGDALRTLRRVRERGIDVPFLILTGGSGEGAAMAFLREGAADTLLNDRLGAVVRLALERRRLAEEKALAEEEIRRRNRELALLNRIIAASMDCGDEAAFLRAACRETASAFGCSQASAALFNEDRTEAVVVARFGGCEAPSAVGSRLSTARHDIVKLLMDLSSPMALENLLDAPDLLPLKETIADAGAASFMFIPLEIGGTVIGGLGLSAPAPHHFREDRIELARSVAGQVSGALKRTRLERDRRLLLTAIEQTRDGVVVTDPAGLILYVNPGFEAASGFARSEAVGRPIGLLDGRAAGASGGAEAPRIDAAWRGRLSNRRKDGSRYTADASITPVRDPDGSVRSVVSVQRDISEQLDMENRYLQAQKMEAVGRLAGGLAHDFNNLLMVILGASEMLAERILPGDPAYENLEEIRKAGERATGLTRQLLTFSRRQPTKPRLIDLNAVVADMETLLRRLLGDDVSLRTSIGPGGCPVLADPGQVSQVIVNLAVNARDAMPRGGVLTLATERADLEEGSPEAKRGIRPGPCVRLRVSDTGTGMDEETLAHVFEPFFTTKEEGKGTGLGLATVYGIVKQADGVVWVESAPGKGATFTVLLPRGGPVEAREGAAAERKAAPRGTEKVLLVEDNETVRSLTARMLSGLGYDVTARGSAAEALHCAGSARFDLLVSDVMMPGMGGADLALRLRKSAPSLPVLFISGYDGGSLGGEASKDGGFQLLQKPFTQMALATAVRAALEAHPTPSA